MDAGGAAMQLKFDDMIPLLVSAYERGRLVPFLGAGMSAPACAQWGELVANLERLAGVKPRAPGDAAAAQPAGNLTARADHAAAVLRNQGNTDEFWGKLREALRTSHPMEVSPQTRALARFYWPLVITTNYDDMFLAAAQEPATGEILPLTRHPWHCKEVMNSLAEPAGRYVWHIQGFLGGQIDPSMVPEARRQQPGGLIRKVPFQRLLDDLVLGHGEYRRVTNLEPQFRRCFAEVFRQRSFLFLGSSLSEEYFLNLFGEILEIYGANPLPHFALACRGKTDARFLLERMNIFVCEYDDHNVLPQWLGRLSQRLGGGRCRSSGWSFALNGPPIMEPATVQGPQLTVRRSILPKLPPGGTDRKDCVAVSVGRHRDGAVRFGDKIRPYLEEALKDAEPRFEDLRRGSRVPPGKYTVRLGTTPYYAVAARISGGGRSGRDLRIIRRSMDELLDRALKDRFERVHAQLLSAGPKRAFPSLYSFTEMVRAFGGWSQRAPDANLHLIVHVVDPAVLSQLSAGLVNLHELLTCPLVRFWAEVDSDERASMRMALYRKGDTPVREIMGLLGVPEADHAWTVTVHPPPTMATQELPAGRAAKLCLEDVGVVPGSTLRFTDLRHAS
jgi:hypothetical protein